MKILRISLVFLLLVVPLFAQTPTAIANPKFTKMEIVFHTVEDRNSDTELEVFIVPKVNDPAVAYLDIDGGSQPNIKTNGFSDNSTSGTIVVPPWGTGFTWDELSQEKILLKIQPKGCDKWRFGFDTTLHFEDGSVASLSVFPGYLTLDSCDPHGRHILTTVDLAPAGRSRPKPLVQAKQ